MKKELFRSRHDRKIGGVCGGIAEYFGISTTIVRLIWALLILVGGTGLLAYIIAWVIIPEER
ncbi:MAG: PspC domain-containing protein [Oscillospiraceae bacterium]|jgi:phage shock protein PspC (stress-responsive transcriptional regulator)|nr:PspC domain-containing protein [Oscillospiraceae bacterium]